MKRIALGLFLFFIFFSFFQIWRTRRNLNLAKEKFALGEELSQKRDYLNANLAFMEVLKRAPRAPFAPQARYRLATNYIGLTAYDQAIKEYERLARDYPQHPKAEDALFMVGMVWKNCIRNGPEARAAFERYLQFYPNGRLAGEVKMYLQEMKRKRVDSR